MRIYDKDTQKLIHDVLKNAAKAAKLGLFRDPGDLGALAGVLREIVEKSEACPEDAESSLTWYADAATGFHNADWDLMGTLYSGVLEHFVDNTPLTIAE